MIGTRLIHYEIVRHLGSGGFGAVYQALDCKLGRNVAVKFLPADFNQDNERVAWFKREARVLASLNHPNIAAIHGLEECDGHQFLVMELVEGETLAERIKRGPIPVDECLAIAKQICEALEVAHEKGIIHRDLKPANIKITPEGSVKVLDFGLAKVRALEESPKDVSNSPTLVSASMPGTILGTAAYMSPEQATGKQVDRASDVWAFGCVLYEMLAGRIAFQGGTVSEILADVLRSEPDWRRLPPQTPEAVRRVLRRCLKKEQKLRFRDIADVRIEIEEAGVSEPQHDVSTSGSNRWERMILLSALGLVTLVAAFMAVLAFRSKPQGPELRFEINTPATTSPASLAISPDGQQIAFVATFDGRPRLWLRSMDSSSARPVTGTDYASSPFWSPDNRSVGFFADGKLQRIDINGGSAQIVASAPFGRGGAWNGDGTILFAPTPGTPIFRVPAAGGEPVPVTTVNAPQQVGHSFPRFLPDGDHFLYSAVGSPEGRGIYISQLSGKETKFIIDAEAAVYASAGQSAGQLLFVRETTLFSQEFDSINLKLSGKPTVVTENSAIQGLAASVTGPFVFRPGASDVRRDLKWFDRAGKEIGKVENSELNLNGGSSPVLSPDGSRVAVFGTLKGNVDVWLIELARGIFNRFTFDAADEIFAVWSPDGARMAFSSNRKTRTQNLYVKPLNGHETEELLLETPEPKFSTDWSPDGRFLVYFSVGPKTGFDIWAIPLEGDRKPFPVVQTNFDERLAQFSRDGNWIAYESNESGRYEIYVQPFGDPEGKRGGRQRISTNGGAQVRWRRDDKELFYVALDGKLMAVPVRFTPDGHGLEPAAPVPLFDTHLGGALQDFPRNEYVVSPDGQRFLMSTLTETTSPITVILNWKNKT